MRQISPESARGGDTGAAGPVFRSILCGVDGSRQSFEAARQAAALATDGALLRLLAVTWETGTGPTATALLSRRRAQEALERARAAAAELGVRAEIETVEAREARARLLEAALDHDLLVVGTSGRSRLGGILIGRAAAAALHRAPVPVLVARRAPAAPFPRSILLATDGSSASRLAVELAAALARRHEARLTVVAGSSRSPANRHELARQAADLFADTGCEPVIIDAHGKPHTAIARAAEEVGASLVITGSRGLSGIAALGSVSERVGECAPCSVLVARRRAGSFG
jgi:nucleotide-binding universal stress UspA family protein